MPTIPSASQGGSHYNSHPHQIIVLRLKTVKVKIFEKYIEIGVCSWSYTFSLYVFALLIYFLTEVKIDQNKTSQHIKRRNHSCQQYIVVFKICHTQTHPGYTQL